MGLSNRAGQQMGRAMRQGRKADAETWQFDDSQVCSALVAMLEELGACGWTADINTKASYAQGSYSYVGSLYIFQRPRSSRGSGVRVVAWLGP